MASGFVDRIGYRKENLMMKETRVWYEKPYLLLLAVTFVLLIYPAYLFLTTATSQMTGGQIAIGLFCSVAASWTGVFALFGILEAPTDKESKDI